MSAAIDFDFEPVVYPAPRPHRSQPRPAQVITLLPPAADAVSPPLRLTRRGVVVLSVAVAMLSMVLVGLAWLSAPASSVTPAAPAVVTVQAGQTLWSIASQVAPGRDPRAEVDDLVRVNHLASVELVPGQTLRTH